MRDYTPPTAAFQPPPADNLIRLDLSNDDFDLINKASKIVDTDMKPFILKAATAKAKEEIAREERKGNGKSA